MRLPLLAAAGLVVALTIPDRGEACDCIDVQIDYPRDGATEVPTNTRLWLNSYRFVAEGPRPVVLEGEAGEIIRSTLTTTGVGEYGTLVSYVPDAELQPESTYWIRFAEPESGPLLSFRTGTGPDLEPPEKPALRYEDSEVEPDERSNSCGEYYFAAYSTPTEADLFFLDVGGAAELDPETLSGRISDVSDERQWLAAGSGACMNNWPGARRGAKTTLRVAGVDYAGNVSAWSDAARVELPSSGASGCSAVGTRPSLLGLALLALLARGPRRRRR